MQNESRARRAACVLKYLEGLYHNGDDGHNLVDFLTDLMHQGRLSPDGAARSAAIHYEDENGKTATKDLRSGL